MASPVWKNWCGSLLPRFRILYMDKKIPTPIPPLKAHAAAFKTFGIGKEKQYFLENLSLMLSSDMPVSQALKALKQTVRSKKLYKIVLELETDINTGQHFWEAF